MAAALAIPALGFNEGDTKVVGMAAGHYGGEFALGIAGALRITDRVSANMSEAMPVGGGISDRVAARVGAQWSFR